MNKGKVLARKTWGYVKSPWVVAAAIIGAIMTQAAGAGAALTITTDVSSDFASVESTLKGYIVAGAVMVVTLALLVVGILMVVRWARRAARS